MESTMCSVLGLYMDKGKEKRKLLLYSILGYI